VESLESVAGEWDRLAARADNVFATREWAASWARHFAPRDPSRVAVVRRPDARAVAILPLYLSHRRPLRVVRFLGHGLADELGPVCAPTDRRAVAVALAAHLARLDCDLLLADELPVDRAWSALGGRPVARRAGPLVRLEAASWEELTAGWSRNLRHQIAKRERRLARAFRVVHRVVDDAARLDADLDTFRALHEARWRGSRALAGRWAFHRDFAARALRRGWLRLRILELDGRPAAALYNLRFAGAEVSYQAGRDPALDRWSVGLLLHARAMRAALAEGALEYRFLRGGEPYKRRFADSERPVETVVVCRGPAGRAGAALVQAGEVVPRPTRRRLLRTP